MWNDFEIILSKKENSFPLDEAIALKHNLTLSRDQIRKVRSILVGKGVHFPTTNQLLEARKKIRRVVSLKLGGKGVKVDYQTLVRQTTESVIHLGLRNNPLFEKHTNDNFKMYMKDGCDGAGSQQNMKTRCTDEEKEEFEHHMFQFGIVPLKLVCERLDPENSDMIKSVTLWENFSPNSQLTVRPVYLIREKETNEELLQEVIISTDKSRDTLNEEGMVVKFSDSVVDMNFIIRDTMKDMKLKKHLSGMKGADCILCHSKQKDWTSLEKVEEGFQITHSAHEALEIFNALAGKEGDYSKEGGV